MTTEPFPMQEYVGMTWIGDEPGIRLQLLAVSLDDARAKVVAQYGTDHTISLWNVEDAAKQR